MKSTITDLTHDANELPHERAPHEPAAPAMSTPSLYFLTDEEKRARDAWFNAVVGACMYDDAAFADDDYNRYYPLGNGRYAVRDYGCIGAWRGIVELTPDEVGELKKL